MARGKVEPLAGSSRLLVDGTNLLHALARRAAPLPAVALTGRLRALVPPGVSVTLVFDGAPAPGAADRRLAAGVEVRYAGRRTADALLADLAAAQPEGTLVVTDDRELAGLLGARGTRTAGTAWLAERLARQRLVAPAAGRPRPPVPRSPDRADRDVEDVAHAGWKPGRRATKKSGNPRRRRRPA
jgi:hypothetical protein